MIEFRFFIEYFFDGFHGTGSEIMQRIAAPMVGGMVSALVLTLLLIPVLYSLWYGRGLEES